MMQRTKNIVLVLVIVVAFTLLYSLLGGNTISLDFGEDSLTVAGPQKFEYVVPYSSISTLELTGLSDPGEPVTGGENRSCRWGGWRNDQWGDYVLCAAKKTETYLLITLRDETCIALNYQDDATTEELYKMFSELLAHYGGQA